MLKRNVLPCKDDVGQPEQLNPGATAWISVGMPSLGWVTLKYLLQMSYIRDQILPVGNYEYGHAACHALLTDAGKVPPTQNAESIAYMASTAYDVGLKGDGPYFGPPCLDNFNQGTKVDQSWAMAGGNVPAGI